MGGQNYKKLEGEEGIVKSQQEPWPPPAPCPRLYLSHTNLSVYVLIQSKTSLVSSVFS